MSVAPTPLPVPAMPASVWQAPEKWRDQFLTAAVTHYDCDSVYAVTGVEAGVSALARLFQTWYGSMRVVLAEPYFDQWSVRLRRAGHVVLEWPAEQVIMGDIPDCDVVVLGRPVNPTGQIIAIEKARELAEFLRGQGGWLILDEAYFDWTDQASYTPFIKDSPAIVLRALGPYSGLMGSNLACVCSDLKVGNALKYEIGTNAVSAGQWWLGCQLLDASQAWHDQQSQALQAASKRLANLWEEYLGPDVQLNACGYWVSFVCQNATDFMERLQKVGVMVRRYHGIDGDLIRCGLPRDEGQWRQLEASLAMLEVSRIT